MDNSTIWLAVVNPHAGSGRTASEWKKAEQMLISRGIAFTCRMTDCRQHATEIACRAAEEGYRRFIAVGGDGTIHEVLGGIACAIGNARLNGGKMDLSEFYLAVIPVGSGNDWIKAHGITHDTASVVGLIEKGSFALQDIAKVTVLEHSRGKEGGDMLVPGPYSYMVNIGGAGLDARVCDRVNYQKNHGKKGRMLYINSLVYNLVHGDIFNVSIECDGNVVYDGECLSVAFGIGQYSGGGLRQTPDAVTDDGLLDYTVIPPVSVMEMLKDGPRLFNGTFTKADFLVCGRCRSMTVYTAPGHTAPVEVDGEIVGALPVRIEILPQQINVLHAFSR
ncbi:MAG: diacylglycerol kinase family lipid kinase [Bacteroidetes bacterium]|uniref:Diacylglycerol kinase family lipid kinase n=1 Tax=Candidatus Cryptobacteroides faecavium TaxID=2840762 RepID=A0A9D9IEJ6_9BACT|nr:diacylglycerol kinase family lipid kinase [Candidatus Cryptobacteroides faecavium]